MTDQPTKKTCCQMRLKVSLCVARVHPEPECGVPDSILADYHDFSYQSPTSLPVSAALSFNFCPWCGTDRRSVRDEDRKIVEVIRPAE